MSRYQDKPVQAKDVDERQVLVFLARPNAAQNPSGTSPWCTHWPGFYNTIAVDPPVPCKVLHRKLLNMARRGLVSGGGHWKARGDWAITDLGRQELAK